MASQYIIQGIFALAGTLSLLAALLDWDWFFTARNAQFVVRNVGRRQARWFYGVLGAILLGMAAFFFTHTPTGERQKSLSSASHIHRPAPHSPLLFWDAEPEGHSDDSLA